jgi:hypothetical protein
LRGQSILPPVATTLEFRRSRRQAAALAFRKQRA